MDEPKYILVYQYHDTNYSVYDNLSLLRIALVNLKATYKNDRDFEYKVYCGKDVTELIDDLDKEVK